MIVARRTCSWLTQMTTILKMTLMAWSLVLSLSSATDSPEDINNNNNNNNSNQDDTCGLYLAVSSTSTVDNPKWGLYAGKTYEKNQPLGFGDVAIQTWNLLAHSITSDAGSDGDELTALAMQTIEYLEQFIWVPQSSGGQFELEEEGGRIVTAIPGAGVLGGYNPKLTNADWNHTAAYFREAWNEQPGVTHPGRGAYSPFYNVHLRSTAPIPAGMEIFVSYGENWEAEHADEEEDSDEITREDHQKIDETVDKMIDFFEKHKNDLEGEAKMDVYNFLIRDVMAAAAGPKKGARITSMLPETPEELKTIKEAGGSLAFLEPTSVRSVEWLRKHGRCMENIRPGPSTIPNAGRGAFANRDIKSGEMVAPVPLVQIPLEHIMEIYPLKHMVAADETPYLARADGAEMTGYQLLLNYCYGHPESTMLFFPAGAVAALINHSKEPNAKMVWSSHPNHHKHWYDLSPEQLIEEGNNYIGLLMEIVATKDIKEGEEVFIDYGDEWVAAWKEHNKQWKLLENDGQIPSSWPIRALDLNQEHKTKPYATQSEQETSPYPDNVMLKCFLTVAKPEGEPPVNSLGQKVRNWAKSEKGEVIDSENLFDCTLLDRQEVDGSWNYTALWSNDVEATLVRKVPHSAIVFADKPGTSDQFFQHSFRHYIGIPDDVFPQGPWRNAAETEEE